MRAFGLILAFIWHIGTLLTGGLLTISIYFAWIGLPLIPFSLVMMVKLVRLLKNPKEMIPLALLAVFIAELALAFLFLDAFIALTGFKPQEHAPGIVIAILLSLFSVGLLILSRFVDPGYGPPPPHMPPPPS